MIFFQEEVEEIETNEETTNQDNELPSTSSVPGIATGSKSTGPKKRKSTKTPLGSGFTDKDQQMLNEAVAVLRAPKDEFDVYGEFVAVELRQIRSNDKIRRLKRKILRAILEIGEEEDYSTPLSVLTTYSNSGSSSSVPTSEQLQYHLLVPTTSTAQQPTDVLSNYLQNFDTEEPLPLDTRRETPHTVLDKPQE